MPPHTDFFKRITGNRPYPYQRRLAEGPWPTLLDIPTGLGKTAAILVAWLWRRSQSDPNTGRRLVYCLPMRSLVQQTTEVAEALCERARPLFEEQKLEPPQVHAMLGGYVDARWERTPTAPCIVVGTQDMVLSRALNRGYAMSRYAWPMHFGLLNNDAFWVLDETQLMGVGVETSAQLQGLRASLGTLGPTHTLWMSATLGNAQLDTVDHPCPDGGWSTISLEPDDLEQQGVLDRIRAQKPLSRHSMVLDRKSEKHYATKLASDVLEHHRERGGLTLVIVNRVARAQAIHAALRDQGLDAVGLVHSRFRPGDRQAQESILHGDEDRVVVATQAIEAGLDVSARTMFTELAPWPSMVQRFGRCNRAGRQPEAAAFWIDIEASDRDDQVLPYTAAELDDARLRLTGLDDVGPERLRAIEYSPPPVVRPILRRRDLLMLFDTSPDLSGHDVDVSPYVRDTEDTDVQLYWRPLESSPNELLSADETLRAPHRDELCRVSLRAARDLLEALAKRSPSTSASNSAWRWTWVDRRFERVDPRNLRPGEVILLPDTAGGYDPLQGFTGQTSHAPVPAPARPSESGMTMNSLSPDGDPDTSVGPNGRWVELAEHLADVEAEARRFGDALPEPEWTDVLATAGRWHDVGKAHEVFQARLRASGSPPDDEALWAKSPAPQSRHTGGRPGFRHELASALAWLAHAADQEPGHRDLIAYLIAAHHGKVRV
ncbi:MAG: CRISPR-associated helicase Cas3', partial [Phormidesmis sp.]